MAHGRLASLQYTSGRRLGVSAFRALISCFTLSRFSRFIDDDIAARRCHRRKRRGAIWVTGRRREHIPTSLRVRRFRSIGHDLLSDVRYSLMDIREILFIYAI